MQGSKPTKPANPGRFEIASELEDGTGLKVIGEKHIFKYDQHKGWLDEFGNYYKKEGGSVKSVPIPADSDLNPNKGSQANKEKKPADASRFEKFDLVENDTGFKLPGNNHIFYFDKYGGWYDEYDNYYNADGVPEPAPEYSESHDDDEEEDDADRLARDYADEEDEGHDELEDYESLYLNTENKKTIESYHSKSIQVKLWNLSFKATEDDFEKFLVSKKIDWIEFEFELNHRDQFNGYVHLTLDKANAEKIIELNGEKYEGRPMKIKVENPKADDEEEEEEEGHEEEGEEGGEGESKSQEKPPEESKTAETD